MILVVMLCAGCGQGEDSLVLEDKSTPMNEVSAMGEPSGDIPGYPTGDGRYLFNTPYGTIRVAPAAICIVATNVPVFGSAFVISGYGSVITHPREWDGLLQIQTPEYPGSPSVTWSAYVTLVGRTASGGFNLALRQIPPAQRCSGGEVENAVQSNMTSPI
ncbi:hypothetical protein LXT21_25955 [Myxococcus sp. K38C18041901]|uniref:hypothetical protein n=1 Tax=Myxococcus guangdongensis TaxID=2906760 RepID=UPI0020A7DC08|nr:hypothetical protein [Myxococcus guangdongensis]MCP3062238.1 hypothetical protein [Myxococcus guangdongensis]